MCKGKGLPGTVSLHGLIVTSAMRPSSGTKYVSLQLLLGILGGPGEGRGGAPGMVPLQNPKVTSQKAYLRNAETVIHLEHSAKVNKDKGSSERGREEKRQQMS